MPILIATRGPSHGQCNICGEIGLLTEDHTPPKGCLKPTQVELRHIVQFLSDDATKAKGRFSQNGVKYRTLCKRCNNTYLGAKYDPAFITFVNSISQLLRSPISLPDRLMVQAQPQAIIRSLIGHMSAQGVDRYLKGELTEPLRDFFLDETLPLPENIGVYYWAYPHRPHIMARDAAYLHIPTGHVFTFWILKFFPIAFLVVWGEPQGLSYPMHSLNAWRASPFNTIADLPIELRSIPPQYWPEAPMDTSVVTYGQEAVFVRHGRTP